MRRKFYFDTSLPPEAVKKIIIQGLGTRRKHKYKLKRSLNIQPGETAQSLIASVAPASMEDPEEFETMAKYWTDPKVQAKALKNKESQGKQTLVHACGSKSLARSAFKDGGVPRGELFIKTHKHKDGTPVSIEAAAKISQMEELMAQQLQSTRGSTQGTISWDPNDVYSKVFGKEKPGHVRGLGKGIPPKSSAWTSSLMPKGTCNDPAHSNFDAFRKEVAMDFEKVFQQLNAAGLSQNGGASNVNFDGDKDSDHDDEEDDDETQG
ncbi:uncharacterized protein LOC133868217 [Alnus glutinosa]|uniref:uncharacterized protein LOC133868217 n=1 Tax=Alnus glutinosa TaxID=3517 RepID=UPI002D771CCF|nr:uncharacterized protein LOC133868217 [Alnus glutinosa]